VNVPRVVIIVPVGMVLVACTRSPAKQAQDAAIELRSWNATLELLNHERARDAVPDRFAEQVRRAAADGRAQAEAQLRAAPSP
jgi:hypothetical protein